MGTTRHNRFTVFLTDDEVSLFRGVSIPGDSLPKTLRLMALEKAQWYVDNARKYRPRREFERSDDARRVVPENGVHYDYSDTQ